MDPVMSVLDRGTHPSHRGGVGRCGQQSTSHVGRVHELHGSPGGFRAREKNGAPYLLEHGAHVEPRRQSPRASPPLFP